MREIPGVADAHLVQVLNYPALQVDVDRLRAAKLGISQRDVANNMLTSLSSSSVLVSPNFFLNPQNNVNYSVAVQTPIDQINRCRRSAGHAGQPTRTPLASVDPAALPAAPVMRLADIATVYPRIQPGIGQPLHRAARDRHRRQHRRPRPGRRPPATSRQAIDEVSKGLPITTQILTSAARTR